ncbi:hypothetical protein D3C80_429970 [compost metagenome]
MIHIVKRLCAPVRACAQDELEIVTEAKQLWLRIAVGDRHQRPFFGQRRQRVVCFLRHIDTATPFGKIRHRSFRAQRGLSCVQPGIQHRLFNGTTTPFCHIVVNVRLGFAQRLAQALEVFVLQRFQRGMVVLHKRQRFLLGTQDHLAVIIKGVIKVKRQGRDLTQWAVKTHYFPRFARGCAESYTEARC